MAPYLQAEVSVEHFYLNTTNNLSGDDQAVRVWDIASLQCIQTIADHNCHWGQITCLQFIVLNSASTDWLFFGTGRGQFLIYRRSQKLGALFIEISSAKDCFLAFLYFRRCLKLVNLTLLLASCSYTVSLCLSIIPI